MLLANVLSVFTEKKNQREIKRLWQGEQQDIISKLNSQNNTCKRTRTWTSVVRGNLYIYHFTNTAMLVLVVNYNTLTLSSPAFDGASNLTGIFLPLDDVLEVMVIVVLVSWLACCAPENYCKLTSHLSVSYITFIYTKVVQNEVKNMRNNLCSWHALIF